MTRLALVLGLVLLTGCTASLAGMTPEQLTALAKDKNASIVCFEGMYAGAKIKILFVNADKGVPSNITIGDDCKAVFDTKTPP